MFLLSIIFLLTILKSVISIDKPEGAVCDLSFYTAGGKCRKIDNCQYAKNLLEARKKPKICGYKENTTIVCCPSPGLISDVYCDLYSERTIQPFFLGTVTIPKEFPHMASLGYGDNENDTKWLCGGSLISRDFILTAAHCIYSQDFGVVKRVRTGDLDLNSTQEEANPQTINVKKIFVHPLYKPPLQYHDLALLQLDTSVKIDNFTRPACLKTAHNLTLNYDFVATGWGKIEFAGDQSSKLLKIAPKLIPFDRCQKVYQNVSKQRLPDGIKDDIQICAGHEDGRDACEGDSGGPLQISVQTVLTIYYDIVGITSFGRLCGLPHSVGVYVRLYPYLEWIENIVWPIGYVRYF